MGDVKASETNHTFEQPCAQIIDSAKARRTILKRCLLQDSTVPPHVQARLDEMFGCPTTPLSCVQKILSQVREFGDKSVMDWTYRIDKVKQSSLEVGSEVLSKAILKIPSELLAALRLSARRVARYHREQPISSWFTRSVGGTVGQAVRAIPRVGVYVPGGTAPLPSTVIMSVIPAVVAGVREIVITSPPQRDSGSIADVTLAACAVVAELVQEEDGKSEENKRIRVFAMGGAQAVGAMAYGTESVPKVDKIVGPGNIFVSIAKKEVFGIVGIDGIYGPTEAVVVADETANAKLVAADLLAQAEHDFMAIPILITNCSKIAASVQVEIERQLKSLSRENVARAAIKGQGGIVLCKDMAECMDLTNEFATEHVSVCVKNPWTLLPKIENAGGVFMGEGSCEVLGDYVAGPSHVMPTGGSARYSSPLSVLDFIKVISVVALDEQCVREVSPHAEVIARAEGLDAHANAAKLRREYKEE